MGGTTAATATVTEIAILGAGFSGLCVAIKLKEQGHEDFVLIERGASVGGTWRDNDYPGAACDVPSHMYSLSFAPNPDWSRTYPTQPELHAYLQRVAEQHGLLPHIRFDTSLQGADFDASAGLWRIRTCRGEILARNFVMANGPLAEPRLPEVPGIESFQGKMFHSAQWDHDYSLEGKRVAVIGTGASAIQFVPKIAGRCARLDVYQRTPNWIIPRNDRPYSKLAKFLFRHVPVVRKLHRSRIYWAHEARVMGMVIHPGLMKRMQRHAEAHIAQQVADPVLRAKVGSSRVDLQACKLEYSIVSPK